MQYVVSKVNSEILRIRKGEDALNFERNWCKVFTSFRHQPWEVCEVTQEEFNKLYQEIKYKNRMFAYERYGINLANGGNLTHTES